MASQCQQNNNSLLHFLWESIAYIKHFVNSAVSVCAGNFFSIAHMDKLWYILCEIQNWSMLFYCHCCAESIYWLVENRFYVTWDWYKKSIFQFTTWNLQMIQSEVGISRVGASSKLIQYFPNSLRPSAYMRQVNYIIIRNIFQWNFILKFKSFHSRKCRWKYCLKKWRPSCIGLNVLRSAYYSPMTS